MGWGWQSVEFRLVKLLGVQAGEVPSLCADGGREHVVTEVPGKDTVEGVKNELVELHGQNSFRLLLVKKCCPPPTGSANGAS